MISAEGLCAPSKSWMQPCDARTMIAVLDLQIICTHLQSYGLVSMPAGLPASLETLCVGTKARGRRIGPSLLMPEAPQLPNVKVRLHAANHLRHCNRWSMTATVCPSLATDEAYLCKSELPSLHGVPLPQTDHKVKRSSHSAPTDI